jgi:hypothetical protein
MRRRRGYAILELMTYIAGFALLVTVFGGTTMRVAGDYRRLDARAAATERLSRVMRAIRDDAGAAATQVVAGGPGGGVAITQDGGTQLQWVVESGRLVRVIRDAAGTVTAREVRATRVAALTGERRGPGLWYVAITLELPAEGRTLAADTFVRVGPVWGR